MAKLLLRDQQLIAGVMYPRGVYSRQVCAGQSLPQPPGQQFCFTPTLAQNLWLLAVDVFLVGVGDPQSAAWWFTLRRGFTLPGTSAEVWLWEDILPVNSPVGLWSWHGYALPQHLHWDMNRLFTGQAQRFAVIFNIVGPLISYIQVSFEVSEG